MVYVNGYQVEEARTREQHMRGLTGRSHSPGMLFIFDAPIIVPVHMLGTLMDLDIIWIDANKYVVETVTLPKTFTLTYFPKHAAKWMLELPATSSLAQTFQVGDRVIIEERLE